MCELTIVRGGDSRAVSAEAGALVSDLLRQAVPSFALPCAGNHTCGKCRVQITGAVEPPDESERRLLGGDDLAAGIRLACSCRLAGDATVTLEAEGNSKIIAWKSKL